MAKFTYPTPLDLAYRAYAVEEAVLVAGRLDPAPHDQSADGEEVDLRHDWQGVALRYRIRIWSKYCENSQSMVGSYTNAVDIITLYILDTLNTPFGPYYDLCTLLCKCTLQLQYDLTYFGNLANF